MHELILVTDEKIEELESLSRSFSPLYRFSQHAYDDYRCMRIIMISSRYTEEKIFHEYC